MNFNLFQALFASAIVSGTPLLFTALGELLGEKVGVMNIGLEGIMLMGGVTAFAVMAHTGSAAMGLLAATGVGTVYVFLFFSVPIVLLKTQQLLPGFGLWFIGLGLSASLGVGYEDQAPAGTIPALNFHLLHAIPFVGKDVLGYPWPVYLAFFLPWIASAILNRTRHGLNVRAIGEDQVSAAVAGVSVLLWRLMYTSLTGSLAGLGGAFLTVVAVGRWSPMVTSGRGWVALAIVIFSGWEPIRLIAGAYLFGGLLILADLGGALGWPIPSPFLSMMPYIGTVVVLVLWSWLHRRKSGGWLAPTALSLEGHVRSA